MKVMRRRLGVELRLLTNTEHTWTLTHAALYWRKLAFWKERDENESWENWGEKSFKTRKEHRVQSDFSAFDSTPLARVFSTFVEFNN